jgi:protease IV
MENDVPPLNPPPPSTPPPFPPAAPPVIQPPLPAPPAKKGRGWMVAALVLLVLFLFSAMFNVAHVVQNTFNVSMEHERSIAPKLEEVMLEDNGGKAKIAVIEVDGVITSQYDDTGYSLAELIKEQLKQADDDDRVKAVVLKVDSPGGEVLASDEIYRAIEDFQDGTNGKPVIASMGNLAASGGYYISSPCRWIEANELTLTGSIGVIMHTWNYRTLMDKVGLRPEVFKSGKFKDMLSGERNDAEIPPEERAMVQGLIDETYQKFKGVVAEGRKHAHELNQKEGKALAPDWEQYADGRVLSGTQALKLGFVDELGNFDDAVDRAGDLGGLAKDEKVNLVEYQPRRDLSDLFRVFGKSSTPALKIDLGMGTPKLQAGQLYFLAPTFIQ